MIKKIFSLAVLSMMASATFAQINFNNYIIAEAGYNYFNYDCPLIVLPNDPCRDHHNHVNTEIPPWIIGGGGEWRSYLTTDGAKSYIFSIQRDLINTESLDIKHEGTAPEATSSPFQESGCKARLPVQANLVLTGNVNGNRHDKATNTITFENGVFIDGVNGDYKASITSGLMVGQDWRRSYYNIYSAHHMNHPTEGSISLGIIHAENKINGANCSSSLTEHKDEYGPAPDANSGDHWPTMAKFVCAKWIYNNESTNWGAKYFDHDMGPITWPSNGYLMDNGFKISSGTSEPSSIIWNGYVYVYYVDHGPHSYTPNYPVIPEHGRAEGVKVIRAPIAQALQPAAWQAYYKAPDGSVHWNPALPPGFIKDDLELDWATKGPKSTDLMGDEFNNQFTSHRFSVAHVRNTNYFIGVECYQVGDAFRFGLRSSTDLVNWSSRFDLNIANTTNWMHVKIGYPVLLDNAGWSNTEVDLNDFYIVGKPVAPGSFDNRIFKYRVFIPGFVKAEGAR